MERKEIEKEIGFIARHYKAGLFNAERAIRKIKPDINIRWSLPRIVAVSCIFIVLGATAGLFIRNSYYTKEEIEIENTQSPIKSVETISKVIDFDDTPLPIVIHQINLVYDVEIGNLPINAENYSLTLHYEGNVVDLIETINEILGTNLEIKK